MKSLSNIACMLGRKWHGRYLSLPSSPSSNNFFILDLFFYLKQMCIAKWPLTKWLKKSICFKKPWCQWKSMKYTNSSLMLVINIVEKYLFIRFTKGLNDICASTFSPVFEHDARQLITLQKLVRNGLQQHETEQKNWCFSS